MQDGRARLVGQQHRQRRVRLGVVMPVAGLCRKRRQREGVPPPVQPPPPVGGGDIKGVLVPQPHVTGMLGQESAGRREQARALALRQVQQHHARVEVVPAPRQPQLSPAGQRDPVAGHRVLRVADRAERRAPQRGRQQRTQVAEHERVGVQVQDGTAGPQGLADLQPQVDRLAHPAGRRRGRARPQPGGPPARCRDGRRGTPAGPAGTRDPLVEHLHPQAGVPGDGGQRLHQHAQRQDVPVIDAAHDGRAPGAVHQRTPALAPSWSRYQASVRASPSARLTCGCHPSSRAAREISGRRR